MDVAVFRDNELDVALRVLRGVALANGSVTDAERQLLEMLAELHGRAVDVGALAPIELSEVVAAIAGEHARKRLVQLAIITAMTDGEVTAAQDKAVQDLAAAVGVGELGLRALHDVAGKHLLVARFDLVRRIMPTIVGDIWEDQGLRGLKKFFSGMIGHGKIELQLGWRYKQLGLLPKGTLGRVFWEHCTRRKFGFPGEPNGMITEMVYHDFAHVLSGYDTDEPGEVRIASFLAGNRRDDGFVFLLALMAGAHLGIRINPNLTAKGLFEPRPCLHALERGAACKVDLTDHWDHWPFVERPLDEVRAELGITPVEPGVGVIAT